ncbi:hypothetical protein O3P69_015496 [Scylla paramamosain]|uniref:Transmembrane protein n=1 Tax=Scylla paramamosain TaxID=85552 RepID=A0AAW0T5P7_SCYPA
MALREGGWPAITVSSSTNNLSHFATSVDRHSRGHKRKKRKAEEETLTASTSFLLSCSIETLLILLSILGVAVA